jgi:hypothetical protein
MKRARILFLNLFFLPRLASAVPGTFDPKGDMIPIREKIPPAMQTSSSESEDETPPFLRWMLAPLKRGMFVRLPIVDTDPNRGVTYGVMPIIVLKGKNDERIEQIHAPSLTYNENFKLSPTYRYYYYPQEDASFLARFSRAKYEHESMLQYEDRGFLGSPYDIYLRLHEAADSGQRFYGIGTNSPKLGEANYKQQYWLYKWGVGSPLIQNSAWRAHLSQRYQATRITNGPLPNLPAFRHLYPQQFSEKTQQTNETRINLDYDTRDHAVTTRQGTYFNIFAEGALRGYLSQYTYERYGTEIRWFKPWTSHPDHVFAIQAQYEQLMGNTPPFWLMPMMGGKYSLRAYGDGRYVDRGVATVNVEQRFKVYEARTAGVTTELQIAPFIGAGQAFDYPGKATARYVRPVVGTAFRAVARPQVVGSVDVGIGREGVSVFTDINYSF